MHFEEELKRNLASAHPSTYKNFESIFMKTLEENAPIKTKIIRGNNKPHMNRTLCRAIMKRSTTKRIANKTKREDDIWKYKDQRNLVVKLNIQSKRHHFRMMKSIRIDNDKEFWKTAKPLFSRKNPVSEKIILIEDGKFYQMMQKLLSALMNIFVILQTALMKIPFLRRCEKICLCAQMVLRAINKYNDHLVYLQPYCHTVKYLLSLSVPASFSINLSCRH